MATEAPIVEKPKKDTEPVEEAEVPSFPVLLEEYLSAKSDKEIEMKSAFRVEVNRGTFPVKQTSDKWEELYQKFCSKPCSVAFSDWIK